MIRRAMLKAVAIPGYQVPFASREMPMPYGWGTGGVQVTASVLGPADVLKVIDQGADDTTNAVSIRKFFEKTAGVTTTRTRAGDDHTDTPPHSGDAAAEAPDPRLPGADSRTAALSRTARDGNSPNARTRGLWPDAREALRRHRAPRAHRHDLCLSGQSRRPLCHGPVTDAEIRQSQNGRLSGTCNCSVPVARNASTRCHLTPASSAWISKIIRSSATKFSSAVRNLRCDRQSTSTRSSPTTRAAACSFVRTPTTAKRCSRRTGSGDVNDRLDPISRLLQATGLRRYYGARLGCQDVSLDIHEGEVIAVVGESGSGKSTLLVCPLDPTRTDSGSVRYRMRDGETRDLFAMVKPNAAFCCAPTGVSSTRTRAWACAWAYPPAATSASG